jgi:hypothetical protein
VSEEPPVREPEGRVVSLVKVKVLLGNGLVKVKTLGEVGVVLSLTFEPCLVFGVW